MTTNFFQPNTVSEMHDKCEFKSLSRILTKNKIENYFHTVKLKLKYLN